jgi:hypothetical protein
MIINITQTPKEIKIDSVKELVFKEPIYIGLKDTDMRLYEETQSPVQLRENQLIYVSTLTANFGEIELYDVIDTRYVEATAQAPVIGDEYVKEVVVSGDTITIIDSDDNEVEFKIDQQTEKTTSPLVKDLTVFTNQEKKLDIENYSKDCLYATTSKELDIRADGVYIKPIKTTSDLEHFEVTLFATQGGKVVSDPTYINITVINLEANKDDNVVTTFVAGRIFTIDNIRPDDITFYEGLDIDLGDN